MSLGSASPGLSVVDPMGAAQRAGLHRDELAPEDTSSPSLRLLLSSADVFRSQFYQ